MIGKLGIQVAFFVDNIYSTLFKNQMLRVQNLLTGTIVVFNLTMRGTYLYM